MHSNIETRNLLSNHDALTTTAGNCDYVKKDHKNRKLAKYNLSHTDTTYTPQAKALYTAKLRTHNKLTSTRLWEFISVNSVSSKEFCRNGDTGNDAAVRNVSAECCAQNLDFCVWLLALGIDGDRACTGVECKY